MAVNRGGIFFLPEFPTSGDMLRRIGDVARPHLALYGNVILRSSLSSCFLHKYTASDAFGRDVTSVVPFTYETAGAS
jgi:hypothetical protein